MHCVPCPNQELEALKAKHAETKNQLLNAERLQAVAEQERQHAQQQMDTLRADMQQLNDMVTAQREARERAEQVRPPTQQTHGEMSVTYERVTHNSVTSVRNVARRRIKCRERLRTMLASCTT